MSILLDALRKSERRKRSGKAPTIHEPGPPLPLEHKPRRGGAMAWILIPAFLVMVWVFWTQYAPPQSDGWNVVDNPPPEAGAQVGEAVAVVPAGQDAPGQALVEQAAPRTPVENLVIADKQPPQLAESPAPAPSLEPEPELELEPEPEPALPDRAGEQDAQQMESALLTMQEESRPSTGVDDAQTAGSAEYGSATEGWSAGRPQPISYWELPESVREELPEFRITVLVYADNPADRFILLNGQRQAEGDSPSPGLEVEEIRRDGVVFTYRLYRFLVKH